MRKISVLVGFFALVSILLAGCQPVSPTDSVPAESEYLYGEEAVIQSLEIMLLESFPVQVHVLVSGYLSDGCVELMEITPERQEADFNLTLTTRRPAGDVECTEALVPFEETVALDVLGLEAGTYTVTAQDQQATFTLDLDNVPQGMEDESEVILGTAARGESLSVFMLETFPVQVKAIITGTLPDGCTKIDSIRSTRDGQTFTLEIQTRKPARDVACTMALVPFEETVPLDVLGLPAGDYVVQYRDLTATFTLDVDNVSQAEPGGCPMAGM